MLGTFEMDSGQQISYRMYRKVMYLIFFRQGLMRIVFVKKII